jgi:hypothetical protein
VPSGGITCGTVITGPLGTMLISNSGDQVTAFTGSIGTPTMLASISTTTWLTSGTTSSNTTYEPSVGNNVNPTTSNASTYNGPMYSNCTDLQNNISNFTNPSNYLTDGTYPYSSNSVLPVKISNIEVINNSNKNQITWTTASETNNSHFEVEKSIDGRNFQAIGKVEGNGNSLREIDYEYMDNNPFNGVNYYRLKQVDFDGRFEYSVIVSALNKSDKSLSIINLNASKTIHFGVSTDNATYAIYNMNGALISSGNLNASTSISYDTYNQGMYIIQLTEGNQTKTEKIFVY